MKIIDVPVFNDDGSVKFTQVVTAEEVQVLLQFAINFLASTGMSVKMLVQKFNEPDQEGNPDITLN
jgi:hypothetical protein